MTRHKAPFTKISVNKEPFGSRHSPFESLNGHPALEYRCKLVAFDVKRTGVNAIKRLSVVLMISTAIQLPLYAQQIPLFSQYFINPYLLNPAAAGAKSTPQAFFTYRKQFAGIPGSPETQALTIDGALRSKNVGLGLTAFNDITNIIGRVNIVGTYAYGVDLSRYQNLRFGLSAGILQNRIFFDRISADDPGDPGLLTNVDNRTTFDGNAGLIYSLDKLKVGFTVNQIFQNEITHENAADFKSIDYNLVRHYIATFGYYLSLEENWDLQAIALLRTAQGLKPQFELTSVARYKDLAWLGTSYRYNVGMNFSLGAVLDEQFVIGYSFELATTSIRSFSNGSHEFTIGFRIGQGTNSPSRLREIVQEIVPKNKEENQAGHERIDELEQINEELQKDIESNSAVLRKQSREIKQLKQLLQEHLKDIEEFKKNDRVKTEDKTPFDTENAVYYLVIGAVKKFENAKIFQKGFERNTKMNTSIIRSDNGIWYFIYTDQLNDKEEAIKKMKALRQEDVSKFIIGQAWVYRKMNN